MSKFFKESFFGDIESVQPSDLKIRIQSEMNEGDRKSKSLISNMDGPNNKILFQKSFIAKMWVEIS